MFRSGLVNRELGIASGKPFSVSTITVLDAGESELLSLDSNL
jgi:ribosomal protein L30E